MSLHCLSHVWTGIEGLTPTDTLLLLALADFTNDETGSCFPSMALLARRTRLDERTVRRRLRSLEARGLVRCETGGTDIDGNRRANLYVMLFSWPGKLSTSRGQSAPPPGAERPLPGGTAPPGRGAVRPPNHYIEPSFEPRAARKPTKTEERQTTPVTRAEARAALESINKRLGRKRAEPQSDATP